ncbi:uncharacterized membrane protein At1g16860-like isoform X1 [Phoenix dactylifera]|uniref:Uncharacterized membrane protein At1g16860-like isoform X1 n=1 Tax=Phoenix dactylifera TaxID=42345 RepID=A0A8B9A793_PHODC|nr:uncharacterized membrane protein At1g16860-like isoform X1 [Phoenix dactylifera]XP_008810699.2 uncharacterized membrane protein At1g16860-like isoform X1 [Phoenix dactylifera]XP_008810700.2 uncharacterized membrane protein At1g16860-like isoform X1 [Phoenix dactylifera]XP_008810702.2 uncharacterized membrane protein At1g16860-like isoform X1 [Phoenix dactylifera]XP_038982523.1 uncharacterized membrane protein At1g16860-like isoform X1 [Phoenix dactylifera]XP_038982524.1 uncharacterized memb
MHRNETRAGGGGGMNDLSGTAVGRRFRAPVPAAVPCVIVPLLLAGLAVSLLILVVVHNALLLAAVLFLSAAASSFLLWNAASFRNHGALLVFLDRLPASDLVTARDGQLIKITGFASCGDLSLESSYEKVGRCAYTSTLLYEYCGFGSKPANANSKFFQWNLAYVERFATDFYITDMKSGTRALVKAGYNSKVIPLIDENMLVNTTSKHGELSSILKKWLERRRLSSGACLLCLKEGYIKEGNSLTVMGMLSRKNGVLMIVPPPEPFSTGCLLQKFLLAVDVDGLVLKSSGKNSSMTNLSLS